MITPRDFDLLFEIGTLRNVPRGWRQHLAVDCASVLEHTLRVVWIALALAREERRGDEAMILKMALVHDVGETRVSDLSYMQKVYVHADEGRAVKDMFAGTSFEEFAGIYAAYERRDTIEAQMVKDADNLDIDLELKEIAEQGHTLPARWKEFREKVRSEKLYTNAGRTFWDALQTADPASWHLTANKWVKIPESGK